MIYIILGLFGSFLAIFIIQKITVKRRFAKIEEIQKNWSNQKKENFDFDRIRKYADTVLDTKFHRLNDQTIEDIDFYDLFRFIDRTNSRVGQQFFFKKLIEPTNKTKDVSEELVNLFSKDKLLREEIQLELIKLNHYDAYFIVNLLNGELLEKPKWYKFLFLNFFAIVILLTLSFKFPVLIIALLFLFTINMFVHYWNKNNTFQFLRSFPQLNILINVSKILMKKDAFLYSKSIDESIVSFKSFQRQIRFINLYNETGIQSELTQLGTYLTELIKAFFLVEVFALFRITGELENKKESIKNLINYIGEIDSSISIASLRAGKVKTCVPNFTARGKKIQAKGMFHPLIEDCVKNDLSIDGKSILITGSNMSGKSTFLRILAINSILAQTIYTCFADNFSTPLLKQFSSIRIDDNLLDGKSYYFQEVNIMSSLLNQVTLPNQNLFLLDEVFKGTNTVERIAAAKAILSYLNHNDNIVIVSTHDIELAEMLKKEYDLYHFTETIYENELHFDHTLKEGPLKTSNAIRILEQSGYPEEVIVEAKKLTSTLKIKH